MQNSHDLERTAKAIRGGPMKRCTAILSLIAFALVGCAGDLAIMSSARKDELRAMLVADFSLASVPAAKEEDFFRVLAAFASTRKPNEFVRAIDFNPAMNEAGIAFTDGGMHGGGFVTVKKRKGRWIIDGVWYTV